MRRFMTVTSAALVALALPAAAFAQSSGSTDFTAELRQANNSGGSAEAQITLDGNMAEITLTGDGFFDGFPHAIHIHGEPGGDNVCPPAMNPGEDGFDDLASQTMADGTPILSVIDGAAFYGGVAASLTTEGDTSPDSALAVERFPTSATLDYQRTIELPEDVANDLSSLHLVVHATDLNGDGEIGPVEDGDGNQIPSSLNEDLPIEATAPAACGQIVAAASGGIDTGAGGTATDSSNSALLAGAIALGGLAAFGITRRRRAGEVA